MQTTAIDATAGIVRLKPFWRMLPANGLPQTDQSVPISETVNAEIALVAARRPLPFSVDEFGVIRTCLSWYMMVIYIDA